MLKKFTVRNFLSLKDQTYEFNDFTPINEDALKAFFILKYLITLSDERPDLVTLIDNEKRPNRALPLILEVELDLNNDNYAYHVCIFNNRILGEHLKINNKFVFERHKTQITLNNEVIVWQCPNQDHKVFLDACATKSVINNDFLYFFKENILSITGFTTNPLNDDIKKLFLNEKNEVTSIIENITIYNKTYIYPHNLEDLNLILKERNSSIGPFNDINSLELRNFLKLNINLSWLLIVGGGVLFLEHAYYSYANYLADYLLLHSNVKIQIALVI